MTVDFITGMATGVGLLAGFVVLWLLAAGRHRRALRASTARRLEFARQRCRPDPRLVTGHSKRRWIPGSIDSFDNEPTQDLPRGPR